MEEPSVMFACDACGVALLVLDSAQGWQDD